MNEIIMASEFDSVNELKRLSAHINYNGKPSIVKTFTQKQKRSKKPAVVMVLEDSFTISPNDETVIKVRGVGEARCCPTDEFNPIVGTRVAMSKALHDLKKERTAMQKVIKSQRRRSKL